MAEISPAHFLDVRCTICRAGEAQFTRTHRIRYASLSIYSRHYLPVGLATLQIAHG